jgi:V/A-type H+/Na+-transporting ATPase subunit E
MNVALRAIHSTTLLVLTIPITVDTCPAAKESTMAEELQSFLNRIHQEGIKSGEDEAQKIIADAQAKAELILKRAKTEGEEIVNRAKKDADNLVNHGKEALRLAARDTLLGLRHELQTRMQTVFQDLAGEALSPDAIAGILGDIIRSYQTADTDSFKMEVLLPSERCQELEAALKARLADSLVKQCSIAPAPGIRGGFQLRLEGDEILYDFSDEALAEAMGTFLSPKLVALLKD